MIASWNKWLGRLYFLLECRAAINFVITRSLPIYYFGM